MTAEHASHRRAAHGGASRLVAVGGWVVAATLAAYVVQQSLTAKAGPVDVTVAQRVVAAAAFWVPVAGLATASVAGLVWSARAYSLHEKSSLLWMRRAFLFGVFAALLLAMAMLAGAERLPREWLGAAAAIAATQMTLFALAARRELRRASGHRRRDSAGGAPEDDRP